MLEGVTREELIEKIRKVEALYLATNSAGEANAAYTALQRLRDQLAKSPEPLEEFQLSLADPWKRQLFLALARRHGYKPFRRYRQRYSSVMIKIAPKYMNQILWPEFQELSRLLDGYLSEATQDIITRAVHKDISEAEETPNLGM
jgi:hypothetical protein